MLKTKNNISFLLGCIIGDGHLTKPNNYNSVSLELIHCKNQKEYLEWKAQEINSILGGKKNKVHSLNNSGYPGVRYKKSHKYLRVLRKFVYKNNNKTISKSLLNKLTPEALAIWWMDDGSLTPRKRNNKIHAWQLYLNTYLSKEENQVIVDYFLERWGIKWNINHDKGLYRLRISTKEGRKFLNIVRPYVSKVDCMKYKVLDI